MRQLELSEDDHQFATLVGEVEAILLLQSIAELYNAARKRQTISLDKVRDFIANSIDALLVVAFGQEDLLPAISLQRS